MIKKTYFERALFFSWYCAYGDCAFCYMSTVDKDTQEKKRAKPGLARRRFESIFAEAVISKELGWKIEFISGGYESYTREELVELVKGVYQITGQKQWLNIGTMEKEELKLFKPYLAGYAGTIESVNWKLRKKICPSKKLEPILETFKYCEELGLKKAMTLIVGLGETIKDFENLKKFIEDEKIDRVTFYSLNPHPDTIYDASPSKEYYCEWISKTREAFPKLEIIAGAWIDKPDFYSAILEAGADNFTKIPIIRKFATKPLLEIESEIKKANRKLNGSLSILPDVDWDKKVDNLNPKTFSTELKEKIKSKVQMYLKTMRKNQKNNS